MKHLRRKLRARRGLTLVEMVAATAVLSLLEMLLLLVAVCLLALVWALGRGKGEIPFGPFLAGGWLAVVLFGAPLLSWYQSLLR